jgi:hypothetical protein
MSNILRRPMFRGGRVDSRGTGITSGLGYAGGGQIGGGTIYGNPMSDGRYGFANPQPANMALFLANQAKGTPSISAPITGGSLTTKLLPQSFLTGMEGLGALTRSAGLPLSLAASPFFIFKEDPLKDNPEEKELQDTATMLTENFLGQPRKRLMENIMTGKIEEGKTTKLPSAISYPFGDVSVKYKEAESPYADFDTGSASREAKAAEQKYFLDKNKKSPLATSTEEDLAFATGVPIEKTRGDETITGGATGNVVSAESGDITLDDYIRMLGGDKARQRDIGDLLGRLSAAALKRPGRGEQRGIADVLGDFMTAEVAAGPGRREKIEQTAAMLDIKDKIESKRSRENIKQLMGMEIFKNKISAKNLAANITDAKGKESNTTRAILDGVQRTYPEKTTRVVKENIPQITEQNVGDIYIVEKTDPTTKNISRYVLEIIKDSSGNVGYKSIYTAQ